MNFQFDVGHVLSQMRTCAPGENYYKLKANARLSMSCSIHFSIQTLTGHKELKTKQSDVEKKITAPFRSAVLYSSIEFRSLRYVSIFPKQTATHVLNSSFIINCRMVTGDG